MKILLKILLNSNLFRILLTELITRYHTKLMQKYAGTTNGIKIVELLNSITNDFIDEFITEFTNKHLKK